ncbi:hypothetical protein [Nonomuraea sp. NPDC049607]
MGTTDKGVPLELSNVGSSVPDAPDRGVRLGERRKGRHAVEARQLRPLGE